MQIAFLLQQKLYQKFIIPERKSKKNNQLFKNHNLMQIKNIYIFARSNGGLAQLARAFDWQSKGHGFDSHILHLIIKELQRLNFVTLFLI